MLSVEWCLSGVLNGKSLPLAQVSCLVQDRDKAVETEKKVLVMAPEKQGRGGYGGTLRASPGLVLCLLNSQLWAHTPPLGSSHRAFYKQSGSPPVDPRSQMNPAQLAPKAQGTGEE